MLVVINFADDKFKQQQIDNCETAITVGKADKVIGYRPEDIDEAFKESYKDIFSFDRGYGLWIWKAYFRFSTV